VATIEAIVAIYSSFRDSRDFASADDLRAKAEAAGLKLVVNKDKSIVYDLQDGYDPAKLEALK
jgi:cysteinyl-tRNA synthetase